jgi:hypothetical protein
MKLLTKEIIKKVPSTININNKDPIAYAKFFAACGRWTWYLIAMDSDSGYCFGYCLSGFGEDFDEYGYFSLREMEAIKFRQGWKVERDRYFTPKKMSEILAKKLT